MLEYIVDASVVMKWLMPRGERGVDKARQIYLLILQGKIKATAPAFLIVETTNVLVKAKGVTKMGIKKLIEKLKTSGIDFLEMNTQTLQGLEDVMMQYGTTAYDSLYLLLVKQKGHKLITADEELLKIKNLTIGLNNFVF